MIVLMEEVRRTSFLSRVRQRHGNHIDRYSRCVFAGRWGLGILSLAQELTDPGAVKKTRFTSERLVSLFVERGEMFGVRAFWRAVKPKGALARRNSNLVKEGNKMKPSIKNEVAGKVHEVKGQVKVKAGQLTNDPDLEAEGQGEKLGGKVQKKIGQVEKVLGK
jgi:uncharacterized protein YjbJ (UPF0337 family)